MVNMFFDITYLFKFWSPTNLNLNWKRLKLMVEILVLILITFVSFDVSYTKVLAFILPFFFGYE